MKNLHMLTFILLVVGGLNWLLVGLFDWNLVDVIFGNIVSGYLAKAIYILVGLSAISEIITHKSNCRACNAVTGSGGPMAT